MKSNQVCSICDKPFSEYGNNPAPLNGEVCCDACNKNIVIPLRVHQVAHDATYALHFKEDGTLKALKPANKYFTLQELQDAVGGYIELYPYHYANKLIVCDEEGLIKNRSINKLFAKLTSVELVGDILLCPEAIFEAPDETS